MIKLFIGIPTYDRRIDVDILKGILLLERTGKYHIDLLFPISSHISRNRNLCVKTMLDGDYDYLLFWDSDISIEGDFIEKMLETGYKWDAKIVCGSYVKKQDKKEYVAATKKGNAYENLSHIKSPQLIDAGGTGIMLISREVLENITDPCFTIEDKPNLECFPEDWYFCRKVQEKGYKIALQPLITRHYGIHPYES